MTWRLVDESTTSAPRNLTREGSIEPRKNAHGNWIGGHGPSVGGTASTTHLVWKHHCGAYACTCAEYGRSAPSKCGKCGDP